MKKVNLVKKRYQVKINKNTNNFTMAEQDTTIKAEIKLESGGEEKVVFKPKRRKNLRPIKHTAYDEEELDEDSTETL